MVELARSGRRASEGVRRGEGAEEPRIEEMELWAQRACLRIAEVTVMHSVTTSATGSIATVTGLERRGIGRSMSAMVAVVKLEEWYRRRGRRCMYIDICTGTEDAGQLINEHGSLPWSNGGFIDW
jgi:hypothetical protein